jgi:hypothetical protein
MAVRQGRSELVATEDIDFDRHEAAHVASPEERVLTADRTTRAAEALRRLKPQELRAIWLKALGHSYAEIGEVTGFSATKVNRCLTEGRKSFLERFEGIETGEECRRWETVLSAMVDGEATAAQLTEIRPHLRNCPACRATLRGLHGQNRSLAAVLPVGVAGAGMKLASLLERFMPGVATSDGGAATVAGGAGLFGVGGVKLAGLLAAGAAATAGGGIVAAHEDDVRSAHRRPAAARTASAAQRAAPAPAVAVTAPPSGPARARAAVPSTTVRTRHGRARLRIVARRSAPTGRLEFAPGGTEPTASTPPPAVAAQRAPTPTPSPQPVPGAASSGADSTRGEFAPQP